MSSLSDEYLIADRLFNYSVDCCASYLLLHDFFRDRKAIEDLDDLLIVRQMFWRVYSIIGSVEKNAGYIKKDDFRKKLVPDQDRISGMDLIELHVIFEAVVTGLDIPSFVVIERKDLFPAEFAGRQTSKVFGMHVNMLIDLVPLLILLSDRCIFLLIRIVISHKPQQYVGVFLKGLSDLGILYSLYPRLIQGHCKPCILDGFWYLAPQVFKKIIFCPHKEIKTM